MKKNFPGNLKHVPRTTTTWILLGYENDYFQLNFVYLASNNNTTIPWKPFERFVPQIFQASGVQDKT